MKGELALKPHGRIETHAVGVGAGGRVFWLLDRSSEIPLGVGQTLAHGRNGPIRFNDVHFTYPSRKEVEVLKGIDLTIQPGTSIALVYVPSSRRGAIGRDLISSVDRVGVGKAPFRLC